MTDEAQSPGTHAEIHLPPNSWVPLSVALAMAVTFVGFLIAPAVWLIGLAWLLGSLIAWLRAARAEYLDLPEHGDH